MTPDVVVDIGNTRIKWGLVGLHGREIGAIASLPDDEDAWQRQLDEWGVGGAKTWVVASVQPRWAEHLSRWLKERDHRVVALTKASDLPLRVGLPEPDKVGIDRLLNAVAALGRLKEGRPAVLISAGSAVTADWLDEEHVFRGGAIYPGIDLMAQALNTYTALLPRVSLALPIPELPGTGTVAAMQAGIFLAVSGGIREAVRVYAGRSKQTPRVFFTGGHSPLLARAMGLLGPNEALPAPWEDFLLWPEQTLLGILRAVEGHPPWKLSSPC